MADKKKTGRHASAQKAARQSIKHRARNQAVLSACKTAIRTLEEQISKIGKAGAEAGKALQPKLSEVQRTLTKAASKKILKRETASRYRSRLSYKLHQATSRK